MADHLWFIPVTGGSAPGLGAATFPIAPTRDLTNVQWNFSVYPVNQQPPVETSCLSYSSITSFAMGVENNPGTPSRLEHCYGHWVWRSCEENDNIVTGGQLAVGTVFSRYLDMYIDQGAGMPPALDPVNNPASWNRVDAWVKFRINAVNINRFGHIFFSINDTAGNFVGLNGLPPRDWLTFPALALNTWIVIHAWKVGNWDNWDSRNLRSVLSVQGSLNPAFVGQTTVDVEWFAFRLSDEIHP